MFDSLEFPEAPSFKAEWKPIYFEPIVNSGEKIVILIVVKNNNELNYFEALHDSVIDSLYGAKALPFKNLVKYIKSQLELNLGELNDCIEGVHSGHWRNASSVNLNGIVRQGLKRTASLGSLAISELYSDIEAQDLDKLESNWTSSIKTEFIKYYPQYANAFNCNVPLIGSDVSIRCGFYSSDYIAKFNVCTTKTVQRMRSSLMDLRILNEHAISDKLDLIIQLPDVDGIHITQKIRNKMEDNISLLKEQCVGTNIEIFPCQSPEDGADRLIKMLDVA
ncbi:hypothetical protein [Acinetobacter modestus]|uniref:hypothetical protein n=1 Tax=Acinetobacter modestus TaxID=1776740 RepID=UPI001F4A4DE7|nr:hypothetical protein [Acinetobacter modestus]MCH7330234.1 hypothetical protein [Acinetobacter modestus]